LFGNRWLPQTMCAARRETQAIFFRAVATSREGQRRIAAKSRNSMLCEFHSLNAFNWHMLFSSSAN